MAKRSNRQSRRGSRQRRVKRNVPRGCIHIKTSFNNTIITVTTLMATCCVGSRLVRWASVVLARAHPLRRGSPQNVPLRTR
jgi:hypothetical protein